MQDATMTSAEQFPPQSIFLNSPDQLRLHVLHWQGPANAPKILLVHGFTHHAWVWAGLAQRLQPHFDVYALDFRGHGDSEWDPQHRYLHEHLQDDIRNTVEALSLHGCHLIGHSLGARVAMLALQQQPSLASSFTIIDTGPDVGAAGAAKVRRDAESQPSAFASVDAFHNYLRRIYALADAEALLAFATHSLRKESEQYTLKMDPGFTRALWNPDSRHNDARDLRAPLNQQLWDALASLQIPTLVMRGAASAILSCQTAEKMANDVIPNAQLKIVPVAGHAVMLDNPEAATDAIETFLHQVK
jgi:pimeloyl-ACP methyl ester carboxylesterase